MATILRWTQIGWSVSQFDRFGFSQRHFVGFIVDVLLKMELAKPKGGPSWQSVQEDWVHGYVCVLVQ
jgi:hypothetical protein